MKQKNLLILIIVSMLLLDACQAPPSATQTEAISPVKSDLTPASTKTPAPTASLTATATATATPTPSEVVVTAVKGNVFIRRGPDLAFDPVSVLMDGQNAVALARDVLTGWLQIRVPDRPDATGWISIQTRFVVVRGEVADLPEVAPTEWPVPAWLRNCTLHPMLAKPGDILIPAVYEFPSNEIQISPGVYVIYDLEVGGNPEVMEIEIKEGSQIDILDDGNGNRRKCPVS